MKSLFIAAALLFLCSCVSKETRQLQATVKSPLFQAILRGNRDEILPLLAKEVQVQTSNPQGRDLVLAILQRQRASALQLVDGGADVNSTLINTPVNVYDGYTPLWLSVWIDDPDLVKALAAKGADIGAEPKSGGTVLGLAANAAMAALLLDIGVPLDKENKGGGTALVGFAYGGNVDVARLLISRGADVEKARIAIEKQIRQLETSMAEIDKIKRGRGTNDPQLKDILSKYNSALRLLDRLAQAPPAPRPAASSPPKAGLEALLKPAAAAVEARSGMDQPTYKVSPNPDAFALVMGAEKCANLPESRFAERDANAVMAHLLAMGYPRQNIALLTGSRASRTELAKHLEGWLPGAVSERSTVFFYFAGHGAPEAGTKQAHLLPVDGDPQYLETTAYPVRRLYEKLAALRAKRCIVVLDASFSGAGERSVTAKGAKAPDAPLQLDPVGEKTVVLCASGFGESTGVLEEQGHGLFTHHLLKALAETAGRGTVSEVYETLKPRVQEEARRQSRAQTPQAFGLSAEGGLR